MENVLAVVNLAMVSTGNAFHTIDIPLSSFFTVIFTEKGIIFLQLIDSNSSEFKNLKPHTAELEQAYIRSVTEQLGNLMDKDKDYLLSLNLGNFYVDYTDIFNVRAMSHSIAITLKDSKSYIIMEVVERKTDFHKIASFIKANFNGVNKIVPNPRLLIKILSLIVGAMLVLALILIFTS